MPYHYFLEIIINSDRNLLLRATVSPIFGFSLYRWETFWPFSILRGSNSSSCAPSRFLCRVYRPLGFVGRRLCCWVTFTFFPLEFKQLYYFSQINMNDYSSVLAFSLCKSRLHWESELLCFLRSSYFYCQEIWGDGGNCEPPRMTNIVLYLV